MPIPTLTCPLSHLPAVPQCSHGRNGHAWTTPGGRRWRRGLSRAKQGLLDSLAAYRAALGTSSSSKYHPCRESSLAKVTLSARIPILFFITTSRSLCPARILFRLQHSQRALSHCPQREIISCLGTRPEQPLPACPPLLTRRNANNTTTNNNNSTNDDNPVVSPRFTSALTKRHSSSWPTHNGR